jgi:uncharacterized protein involved in exopolysaccharide biosynthesis
MEIQDILKYFKIIRKWWWVIILLFTATVGTMLAIAFLTETQYEATVIVQVSAPPPQEEPLYSRFGRQPLREEIDQTRGSLTEFLQAGGVIRSVLKTLPDISMDRYELGERITIDIPDNSQLMNISVRASDPEAAALLANTLIEVGLKEYGQLLAQPTVNTRQFIEQELEVARAELTAAETELMQFQIDNKIGNLQNAINSQYDLVGDLRFSRDLARVSEEIADAQAIENIILEREAELQNMVGLSTEYNQLVDRVERARTTYDFLLDRKVEAQIKENQILALGSIQVITPASSPQRPASIISGKLIVLGAVASLLAGVLLIFLLEYLDISGAFRSSRHFERPELTAIPENVG